jgi:hypothetical protein
MRRCFDVLLWTAVLALFPAMAIAEPTAAAPAAGVFVQLAERSPAICPAAPRMPAALPWLSVRRPFEPGAPAVASRHQARPLSCNTCFQARQECSASCGGSPSCVGASCYCCVEQFTCDPADPCNYTCICKPCCF